jgi:succinyl-diaminopimelate desuccinylase
MTEKAKTLRLELENWIDEHREAIIEAAQRIVRVPSVADTATMGTGAPFGRAVADALEQTLSLCAELGMRTENFGGYAGHAEFGEGEEIAAMLGHLDVVPPGDDWTCDPWGGEVRDGFLWGRGASDDKGPTYAALFGAKAVMDVASAAGVSLSRRVRLIFGCDEESLWRCMEHYFGAAGQPLPTVAFTPDADFPLVHAEKGSFTAVVQKPLPTAGAVRFASLESGRRPNMVPDKAVALLVGEPDVLERIAHVLDRTPGLSAEFGQRDLAVLAAGVSAHGASPGRGDNAAIKLLQAVSDAGQGVAHEFDWAADLAARGAPDGTGVGISGQDDVTGPLTSNLGVVTVADGAARATFNIRYPATWDGEETIARFRASLAETGWEIVELHHTPPLYVPVDQEPVKTLLRVYREHTGDLRPPTTMGGRTYATSVAPVGVAFGAAMPGDPDVAHQADERFSVDRLIQAAKIYAHALYELAK